MSSVGVTSWSWSWSMGWTVDDGPVVCDGRRRLEVVCPSFVGGWTVEGRGVSHPCYNRERIRRTTYMLFEKIFGLYIGDTSGGGLSVAFWREKNLVESKTNQTPASIAATCHDRRPCKKLRSRHVAAKCIIGDDDGCGAMHAICNGGAPPEQIGNNHRYNPLFALAYCTKNSLA